MYELFLLGKLMDRPWHGYEFQRVLSSVLGPLRQVSWGTIYPLLRRLEKGGLIQRVLNGAKAEDRRGRQHYSITSAGRERFLQLMRAERRNDPDYRDTFRIMIGNFGHVDPEVRRHIIESYVDQLSVIASHSEAMSKLVENVPGMKEPDRNNILLALAHERFLAEADREWVQKQMTGIFQL
jgi:DNA-binding PadR family transcriptional regulator